MSEYQYYEFLAVDRPLTRSQIAEVREFSSRADISATSFVNEYNFGNFRGNPDLMVTKYFDLMVYFANWGTHRLLVGLPAEAADLKAWRQYESEFALEFRKGAPDRVIVEFFSEDEEGWDDESDSGGLMASLAPIREELLNGDPRPLYLAWLAGIERDEDADDQAPPVPAGLKKLTSAQKALADFLRVDEDLLGAAARDSTVSAAHAPSLSLDDWVRSLPPSEKDRMLQALIGQEDSAARAKVIRQYRAAAHAAGPSAEGVRRTAGELRETAEAVREHREALERAAAERLRERERAKAAAALEARLKTLMDREADAWHKVEQAIEAKQSSQYEAAVATLRDLRELAIRKDALDAFTRRIRALREANRYKSAFIRRLDQADLLSR